MVSELLAQEFKQVIQEELGIELSVNDAQRILSDMVGYLNLLADISQRDKTDVSVS